MDDLCLILVQVLHMECKETGEFAHRETTEYEQVSRG